MHTDARHIAPSEPACLEQSSIDYDVACQEAAFIGAGVCKSGAHGLMVNVFLALLVRPIDRDRRHRTISDAVIRLPRQACTYVVCKSVQIWVCDEMGEFDTQ